ncbi:murein transglycosylase [Litorivita pollutaquae]|uniref:peptidoglycan lytic exotransglycosylase n=1 Tax=Litorivita pollutaquae TaxID=2200892 RepID=A0A2V4MLN5_9RHOB|nr:MltA domain-containing protein [Litorivita pollutaquae]PYC47581.1 murein transglycosylase [Litorivita pollutaquae]
MTWRAVAAGLCTAAVIAPAAFGDAVQRANGISYDILSFDDLDGWGEDDYAVALQIFKNSCDALVAPDWAAICAGADDAAHPRAFFEDHFHPTLIRDSKPPLFTGYYEPEIDGARAPSARFSHPVYALPPEVGTDGPWFSRREILRSGVLENRGLELAWIEDPVDHFFLQVQGSGRIHFGDGDYMRLGYAGKNGHPYYSIGRELVRRGTFAAADLSADALKIWLRAHPVEGAQLLLHNPSYVFFRDVTEVSEDQGPIGAMGVSVTAHRSIAVDPAITPLGAPVWVEKDGAHPVRRLMVAQDTGSAIKGAQRADLFFGTGEVAGHAAGRLNDSGRMVVLLPKPMATGLAEAYQ